MNAAQGLLLAWVGDKPPRDPRADHAHRGTPPRLRQNIADVSVGEEVLRLTRGERKRLARAMTRARLTHLAALPLPANHVHPRHKRAA